MKITKLTAFILSVILLVVFAGCGAIKLNDNSLQQNIENSNNPQNSNLPVSSIVPEISASPTPTPSPEPSQSPEPTQNIEYINYKLNQIALKPIEIYDNFYQSCNDYVTFRYNFLNSLKLAKFDFMLSQNIININDNLNNIYISDNYNNKGFFDNELSLDLNSDAVFNKQLYENFNEYEFSCLKNEILNLYLLIDIQNFYFDGNRILGNSGSKKNNIEFSVSENNLNININDITLCDKENIECAGMKFNLTLYFKLI